MVYIRILLPLLSRSPSRLVSVTKLTVEVVKRHEGVRKRTVEDAGPYNIFLPLHRRRRRHGIPKESVGYIQNTSSTAVAVPLPQGEGLFD